MSLAASMNATAFRPTNTLQARRNQPRLGRTHLSVHAVTNWLLEPKQKENKRGQFLDLTEAVASKSVAYVKSGGGGDFVRSSSLHVPSSANDLTKRCQSPGVT